jgi:methyltransferase (TIGR00027 family)
MKDPSFDATKSPEGTYTLLQEGESPLKDISDTALWAAVYRTIETARSDALFKDDLAQRLAGPRGKQIVDALPEATKHAWVIVVRTYLIDRYILEVLNQGVDMVINLAAGLDARPYRMDLPAKLKWVEVDLPGLLAYKEEVLRSEKPVCSVERIGMDLSNKDSRRTLFQELERKATRVLIVTEGLLIYLSPEEASSLARDLALPATFRTWIFDLHLPGLVRVLQQQRVGSSLAQAGAPLKFTANGGPEYFVPCGWPLVSASSMLDTAAQTKRLPREWTQHANPSETGVGGNSTPSRSRRIDGFVCSSTRP